MTDKNEWTRDSLLAEIDRCVADATDEDSKGDSDRWMVAMVVRAVLLLKVAARFLREEKPRAILGRRAPANS